MVADRAGRDAQGFHQWIVHRGEASAVPSARIRQQWMQSLDGREAGEGEGLELLASNRKTDSIVFR